jgi:hypothetical protein
VIASRPDRRARAALLPLAAAAALACGGGGIPRGSPLEPAGAQAAFVPDASDRAARDVAAAALGTDPDAAQDALARLEAVERARGRAGEAPSGLAAYAQHVVDATAADPIAYRRATATLLGRDDVDPVLRKQLQIEVDDDPLVLADRRLAEGQRARIARDVNAITEALGRSMTNFIYAPIRVAQALIRIGVAEHLDDPISLQERQALAYWKQYVEEHPETPQAHALVDRIESMQRRWFDMKRQRSVRAAEQALDHHEDRLALVLADQALRYVPEDDRAIHLREEAYARVQAERAERARSLEAADGPLPDAESPRARDLLLAELGSGDVAAASRALLAADPNGPLADPARFAAATAEGEAGHESAMWKALGELADRDDATHPMARHAHARVYTPEQNPWGAFQRAKTDRTLEEAGFVALGPLAHGTRDLYLPRPIEWLIEAPSLLPTLGGIPMRVLQTAIAPPDAKGPAVAAQLYLDRHPHGEHAQHLRHWLVDYEEGRGRHLHAHAMAVEAGDYPPERIAELAEKAAAQLIEIAQRQRRADLRLALLQADAQRYPDTKSGARAAHLFQEEIAHASEQRIRISRGFLLENPRIAGPAGLGLRPELLDGDPRNGELHPEGVTLLGGRRLEVSLVAASGKASDPPVTWDETLSAEQLSRLVSMLEEASIRNALLDPLAEQDPDARRDLFFERARLGVADAPDERPSARSSYAFVGVREKYNMVRSRESILPFDIVISGTFPSLGLGAFPRLRMPKETPDAPLYK